jgi:phosphoribosylaminoimidazolecarboxamide formyltransferase/IMP cyclohydrolase
MGGIVAVNRTVDAPLAEAIMTTYDRWGKSRGAGGFYAEIVIAPGFDDDAIELIRNHAKPWGQRVRLLAVGELTGRRSSEYTGKHVVGGLLLQQRDLLGLNEDQWRVVTDRAPTAAEMDDLRFAWLVAKHVKSNAIVLAKGQTLLGAGAGQMSRVNSSRLAVQLARQYGGAGADVDPAGCAVASDAFFPFPDGLDVAAEIGAAAVIQPGGAKKDDAVIDRANQLGVAMIFTGTRHFNH